MSGVEPGKSKDFIPEMPSGLSAFLSGLEPFSSNLSKLRFPALPGPGPAEIKRLFQERCFLEALREETELLVQLHRTSRLEQPVTPRFGHEAEYFLVDAKTLEPCPVAPDILGMARGEPSLKLVHEMGKFQIERLGEVNENFGADGLLHFELGLSRDLFALDQLAAKAGALLVPTGMLPTLQGSHLSSEMMTGNGQGRYAEATRAALRDHGGKPWEVVLHRSATGKEKFADQLRYTVDNTMSVAQTCSLQPHIQCCPEKFTDLFNSFIMSAGFALAPATASPIVQGQIAEKESRIQAFEQAWIKGRVLLGRGYINHLAQPFFENARDFKAIFTDLQPETGSEHAPDLWNLRLQNGSVHRWVRPVYGSFPAPHVRIELRTLPMSSAPHDNAANVAWAIGLAYGFAKDFSRSPAAALPYWKAEENLREAAKYGLEAEMWIPTKESKTAVQELRDELLETGFRGLKDAGVDQDIALRYLDTIEARFKRSSEHPATEADWIVKSFESLSRSLPGQKALERITAALRQAGLMNVPVHEREVLRAD